MIIILLRLLQDRYIMSIEIDLTIKSLNLALFLIFIFLSIQIWFVWKDIDKEVLKKSLILGGSFFKRNCIYVYCFSVFIFIHGIIEEIDPSGLYVKLLGVLTFFCLVMFTYDWYTMLTASVLKKSIPQELIDLHGIYKRS